MKTAWMLQHLAEVVEEMEAVKGFLEFLRENGYEIGKWEDGRLVPANDTDALIDEYFDIDREAIEEERAQLIATLKGKR